MGFPKKSPFPVFYSEFSQIKVNLIIMGLQSVFISLLEKAGSSGIFLQLSSVMELSYSGFLRKLASGTPRQKVNDIPFR